MTATYREVPGTWRDARKHLQVRGRDGHAWTLQAMSAIGAGASVTMQRDNPDDDHTPFSVTVEVGYDDPITIMERVEPVSQLEPVPVAEIVEGMPGYSTSAAGVVTSKNGAHEVWSFPAMTTAPDYFSHLFICHGYTAAAHDWPLEKVSQAHATLHGDDSLSTDRGWPHMHGTASAVTPTEQE